MSSPATNTWTCDYYQDQDDDLPRRLGKSYRTGAAKNPKSYVTVAGLSIIILLFYSHLSLLLEFCYVK